MSTRNRVGQNAAALYVLQAMTYVVPVLTVPFLLHVLGPTGFGRLAIAQGLVAYADVLAGFGFNYTVTRRISVDRFDPEAVGRTAGAALLSRMIMAAAGGLLILVLVSVIPRLESERLLVLLLYGTVAGNALFPTWLFEGLERMVPMVIIILMPRLLAVAGMFAFVRQPDDVTVVAALEGARFLVAGAIGLAAARFWLRAPLTVPRWRDVRRVFAEGWVVFLSVASVSLYTAGNAFVLGMLTNAAVAGYFSAAERIVRLSQGLLSPLSQAMFPRMSRLVAESKDAALRWGRRALLAMGAGGLLVSGILFIGAPAIAWVVMGPGYGPSVVVLRILALVPFVVAISNVLGVQVMLPFGEHRAFATVVVVAAVINLTLALAWVPGWQAAGMAAAVLTSETCVTIGMLLFLRARHLNPLRSAGSVSDG